MKYIKLFRSKPDYEKIITEDNVINVIGLKGSGKTTLSKKYLNDTDYIVINCDSLYELPSNDKESEDLINIREFLKNKYGDINESKFIDLYNEIINYVFKRKKKCFIEGNSLEDIDVTLIKGRIIIKRTGVFKCFKRAVKRDYNNKYFMDLEKKNHKYFYKITRLHKVIKRRKKIFKQAKDIDRIIGIVDEIKE